MILTKLGQHVNEMMEVAVKSLMINVLIFRQSIIML